jgi:DNA-binding HxlR family transcriptional regulator
MEVLNGKWKGNLVWYVHNGIKRPGELKRRLPQASRRLLDTQLKQLAAHGVVSKISYNELPKKVDSNLRL